MELCVVGISHHTAPLALRERLALLPHELAPALAALRQAGAASEVVLLSTCNRLECYLVSSQAIAPWPLLAYLAGRSRMPVAALMPHVYQRRGRAAVAHLCRVTAGLDSMVLGESEIAAQVKQSYAAAWEQGATGPVLNRLFQQALHCAKLVRSRTQVTAGAASIGAVVTALMRQTFGEHLGTRQALLWGAGKAAETTARHLIHAGVGQLWMVNRTAARAQELAALCQGGWLSWQQALRHLAVVDVAIVCTQAPHYVVDADDLAAIVPARGGRPLCLIDVSVPRNVDPASARLPGVSLHNIDDLQRAAQHVIGQRRQELIHCERIIQEQVQHFDRRRGVPAAVQEEDAWQVVGASSAA